MKIPLAVPSTKEKSVAILSLSLSFKLGKWSFKEAKEELSSHPLQFIASEDFRLTQTCLAECPTAAFGE